MPGRGLFALAVGSLLMTLGWVSQSGPVSATSSQSKEKPRPGACWRTSRSRPCAVAPCQTKKRYFSDSATAGEQLAP